MTKKLGLVLGSGGARGIAHIGFLQALLDNNFEPDVIAGSSMGSVVGACYLAGNSPKQMFDFAKKLKKGDILDFNLDLIKSKGFFKGDKMEKLLKKLIGDKTFSDLPIPFGCVATDLVSGKSIELTTGNLVECVKASSSIPLIFPPVTIGNTQLIDGGCLNRLPVSLAKKLGADITVAVDVLGELPEYDTNGDILHLALRWIDVVDVNNTKRSIMNKKPDILVCPDMGKISQYDIKNQQLCYDAGYKSALTIINKLKDLMYC